MKPLYITLLIPIAFLLNCSTNKSGHTAASTQDTLSSNENISEPAGEWEQMDNFHMLMAESFHPYMDSGNLQPARNFAAEMATAAETWANTSLPARINNKKTQQMLAEFSQLNTTFANMVEENAPDKALADTLTSIHDHFHAFEEVWYGREDYN